MGGAVEEAGLRRSKRGIRDRGVKNTGFRAWRPLALLTSLIPCQLSNTLVV